MSNQTFSSVEWLFKEMLLVRISFLENTIGQSEYDSKQSEILDKAKEMHKEEIMKANKDGVDQILDGNPIGELEYYELNYLKN